MKLSLCRNINSIYVLLFTFPFQPPPHSVLLCLAERVSLRSCSSSFPAFVGSVCLAINIAALSIKWQAWGNDYQTAVKLIITYYSLSLSLYNCGPFRVSLISTDNQWLLIGKRRRRSQSFGSVTILIMVGLIRISWLCIVGHWSTAITFKYHRVSTLLWAICIIMKWVYL